MPDHTLEVPKFEGDIFNSQMVGMQNDQIVRVQSPLAVMTKEQALVHAAWLVAIVDRSENFEEFRAVLKAVLEA